MKVIIVSVFSFFTYASYGSDLNCYNLNDDIQRCERLEYALQVKNCLESVLSSKDYCQKKIKIDNQNRINNAYLRLEKTKARLKIDSENLVTSLYNDFVDHSVKSLVDYNSLAGEFNSETRRYFHKVKSQIFKKSDKLLSKLSTTLSKESVSYIDKIGTLNDTSVRLEVLLNNFRFFKQQFLLQIENNNFKDEAFLQIHEKLAYLFDPAALKLEAIQKETSSLAVSLYSEYLIEGNGKHTLGDFLRKKRAINQANSKPTLFIPSLNCNQLTGGCSEK